jgi:hypothetical protein
MAVGQDRHTRIYMTGVRVKTSMLGVRVKTSMLCPLSIFTIPPISTVRIIENWKHYRQMTLGCLRSTNYLRSTLSATTHLLSSLLHLGLLRGIIPMLAMVIIPLLRRGGCIQRPLSLHRKALLDMDIILLLALLLLPPGLPGEVRVIHRACLQSALAQLPAATMIGTCRNPMVLPEDCNSLHLPDTISPQLLDLP